MRWSAGATWRAARQGPAQPLVLAWLAILAAQAACYNVPVGSKATTLVSQLIADGQGIQHDILGRLTDTQRRSWSHDPGLNINKTLAELAQPRVKIVVNVKLVGFHGEGNGGINVDDHQLQRFVRSLHAEMASVVLNPEPRHLIVRPDIEFRVTPVYHELISKINVLLGHSIQTTEPSTRWTEYPLHLVPYSAVNDIIHHDYETERERHPQIGNQYTLYLLNPMVAEAYAYKYDEERAVDPHSGVPPSPSCPGSLWVAPQRFAWFDLTANLSFYGPGPGGKGQVFDHSVPLVRHYKPEAASMAMLPDLAALAWSFTQHLVWPPVHLAKPAYHREVHLHVVYMHQHLVQPPPRLDIDLLRQQLQAGLGMAQIVSAAQSFLPWADCDHCVAAFHGALRARTARSPAGKGFKMDTLRFLDTQLLVPWLEEWGDAILSDAGARSDGNQFKQVLPVFVFDVTEEHEAILLDGWRQAVAMDSGAVMAIHSVAPAVPTFFGCHEVQVHIEPHFLHRPVLAALLQAGWGVADTSQHYSMGSGQGWSFLWSLGATPFGPLASGDQLGLSFAQRDAQLRNLALLAINSSLTHVSALLGGFGALAGGDQYVKEFLNPEQVIPWNQRMNLLLFKLQQACQALSQGHLEYAVLAAHHMVTDVAGLHAITHQTKGALTPDLQCHGHEARRLWWSLPGLAGFLLLAALVWRCSRGMGEAREAGPYSSRSSSRRVSRMGSLSLTKGL